MGMATVATHAKLRLGAEQRIADSLGNGLLRRLPFITLDILSLTPGFRELCARALIDLPVYADAQSRPLRLVIADQESRPDLAMPEWHEPTFGLGALIEQLESEGLDGCFDAEYRSWQLMSHAFGAGLQLLDRPEAFPPWERAFPLRNFLHWSYAAEDRRLIHAGSLGHEDRGVLLAGAGGAGKSGTTLAGILHGLESVGDDYLALDLSPSCVRAFPLMKLMKQDAQGLARLGLDARNPLFGAENWQEKFEFDFDRLAPGSRAQQMTISAILLPRITGRARSQLSPASSRDAMFALMPNNLRQLPGRMKQGFNFISRLSRVLPCYHLDLSDDPQEIAETILNFLQRDPA